MRNSLVPIFLISYINVNARRFSYTRKFRTIVSRAVLYSEVDVHTKTEVED